MWGLAKKIKTRTCKYDIILSWKQESILLEN